MANPVVIDISHHQPDPINWDKVKAGGTIGVIHKATEGTVYVDPKLFARMKEAKAAGLLTCTYHFLRGTDMVAQMEFYLKVINPVQGERVCLDHEHAGCSLAELLVAVSAIQTARPDLQITIYSGHLIEEQLGGKRSEVLAETSLWTAQYRLTGPDPWPKATWPQWSLWQYTDKATCNGITGPVDGNRWNGSEEALVNWLTPAVALKPPERKMLTVRLDGLPEDYDVRLVVDGKEV